MTAGRKKSLVLPEKPDFSFETAVWKKGLRWVAGIDEAGRGALAGPVFAAIVVFPKKENLARELEGVQDSKQLSELAREKWSPKIKKLAQFHATGMAQAAEIDNLGIAAATRLAIRRALLTLPRLPDHLLVDYIRIPDIPIPQTSLVKGDCRSLSIAAASILAKTARDRLMGRLDAQFPGYCWSRNKGYGTAGHRDAIQRLGPSPQHRLSFAPIKNEPLEME